MKNKKRAFTLIELIIVIGIIAILSTALVVAWGNAAEKARKSKARGDIQSFVSGINMLKSDTKMYPSYISLSCVAATSHSYVDESGATKTFDPHNDELSVDSGNVGLAKNYGFSNWKGPYISNITKDPWGNNYIFDPDYVCGGSSAAWPAGELELGCNGLPGNSWIMAITSNHRPDPNSPGGGYGGGNVAALVCKP